MNEVTPIKDLLFNFIEYKGDMNDTVLLMLKRLSTDDLEDLAINGNSHELAYSLVCFHRSEQGKTKEQLDERLHFAWDYLTENEQW